jgi:PKD repeat protein
MLPCRYIVIILGFLFIIPVVSAYGIVFPELTVGNSGDTASFELVLDQAPEGLSGYNMTLVVSDPQVAEFTAVTFPAWAEIKGNGLLPSSSVWIKAADLGDLVLPDSTQVPIATITIRGKTTGSTSITAVINQMSNDSDGLNMTPTIRSGTFTVGSPDTSSAILSVNPSSASFPVNTTKQYQITADAFSGGLAGYDLVVTLPEDSVGQITAVEYPSWGMLNNTTSLSSQSVKLSAVDLSHMVEPGATGVLLATITVKGTSEGSTPINLGNAVLDADGGNPITVSLVQGEAIVTSQNSSSPPVANFNKNVSSGQAPLTVHFTDTSTGSPDEWAWDFNNDGNIDSTVQNPSYTYINSGSYSVKLTASNADGSDTRLKSDFITVTSPAVPPVANFAGTPVSGTTPLAVQFTDQSTGTVNSYTWDFNNDGVIDSTVKNPGYTYDTAGTYSVNLTVTGPGGADSEVKTNYITVTTQSAAPVAGFTGTPVSGTAPLSVQFTDQSTGSVTSYAWDFNNDGIIDSTAVNPGYSYQTAGTYSVKLTVTGPGGSDEEIKTDYITVSSPTPQSFYADFSVSPTSGMPPLTVKCTDKSIGNPYSFYYDFGDGVNMTGPNPTHTYRFPGRYTITLTIFKFNPKTNSIMSSSMVKTNVIAVNQVTQEPLVAKFTALPVTGTAPLTVIFTDQSTGNPGFFNYDFGDGTNSTDKNPVHTYRFPGVYDVTMSILKNDVSTGSVISDVSVQNDLIVVQGT